ncbi:hypothetical protein NFJ02_28g66600 [Pycnococcus provasolii]
MESLDAAFLLHAAHCPPDQGGVTAEQAPALGRLLLRARLTDEVTPDKAIGLFALSQAVLEHVLCDADESNANRVANEECVAKIHEAIAMNEVMSRKLASVSRRNAELEQENKALKAILYGAANGGAFPFPVTEVGGPARAWTTQDAERAALTIQKNVRGHRARRKEEARRDEVAAGLWREEEDEDVLSVPASAHDVDAKLDAAAWGEWEELRPTNGGTARAS